MRDEQFLSDFRSFLDARDGFANPLSLKKRFEGLYHFLTVSGDNEALIVLAIAWYLAGLSPERGLFPAQLYRIDLPNGLQLLQGERAAHINRQYCVDIGGQSLFILYGKGSINSPDTAISVWKVEGELSAH